MRCVKYRVLFIFVGISSLFSAGCGLVGLGGGTSALNDSTPSGTIIAQGAFSGLNGKSVSGTALIYRTDSLVYILRLQGFSAPTESGLLVRVEADGNTVLSTTLRGTSGNQNYTISSSPANTWSNVTIRSTVVPSPNNDYGTALLDNLLN